MQLEIIVHDKWGDDVWAQEKYLVHGFDDVLWTSDPDAAIQYLRNELKRVEMGEFNET